jgi:hypothetical protein
LLDHAETRFTEKPVKRENCIANLAG